MKTIKIIDLLNKIANEEEVPKKFIYVDKENIRYVFEIEEDKDYWCEELGDWFFSNFSIQTILNEELEIIEEDKEIEDLKEGDFTDHEILKQLVCKTRQLISEVNELKKGK